MAAMRENYQHWYRGKKTFNQIITWKEKRGRGIRGRENEACPILFGEGKREER